MTRTRTFLLVLTALGLVACGDDDSMTTLDAGGDLDAGEDVDASSPLDGGDDQDAGDPDAGEDAHVPSLCPTGDAVLEPLGGTPGFAVLGSDYTSTTIAVLDPTGGVMADGWVDSGTTAPGLVAPLGGDVVLPDQDGETLVLLDRFGADVATRFCPEGGLVGQVRFSSGDGFGANPHDVGQTTAGVGLATRHERNMDRAAADLGNDVVGFDPDTMTRTDLRVDLDALDEVVSGLDGEGAATDVQIRARPSHLAVRGDYVVVGLSRLPENLFGDSRGHGDGRVAVIGPDLATVETVELNGLADCGVVRPVPGTTDEVIVSCNGYSDMGFGEPTGTRATAGMAHLRVGATNEVLARWNASDDESSLLATWSPVPMGGSLVVAIALPDFVTTTADDLVLVDLATGTQTPVATAAGSFVLGQGALRGDVLLVPDATEGDARLHRFTWDGSSLTAGEAITVGPASLPPRAVAAL